MNDVVQFVVKMKDMMSGGMRGLASTTQSAFRSVDATISRTQQRIASTRPSVDSLNKRLDDLKKTRDLSINTGQIRSANREIERLERQINRTQNVGRRSSSSGSGGILGLLGGTRGLIAGSLLAAGTMAVGTSLGAGMQGGAQKVSFETMAGKNAGGALYGDITKFARQSIYGNELYGLAQQQLAFGATAKEVMPTLKMLGDISMGDKEKLSSLNLAFSQVRANGRLMGQDLLQLVNAGFNPLQIISEKTGRSLADLRKDMEKGSISFGMVKKAFETATAPGGKFFDMTNRIAETPFGQWEAFKGQIQGLALQFGTVLLPVASKVIGGLSAMADYIPPIIDALQPFFTMLASSGAGDYFQGLINGAQQIGAAVLPIFSALKPVLTTILQVSFDLGKKVSGMVVPAFQRVAPILGDVAHILGNVLSPALRIVGWGLGKIVDLAGWVAEKLTWLLKPITALFSWVSDGVGWMLDKVADTVDHKTPTIAERLKNGISNDGIVSFFKQMGQLHGTNYVNGLLGQYQKVALFMDKFYKTSFFSAKFNDIATQMGGGNTLPEVVVTAKSKGAKMPGSSGSGFEGLGKNTSSGITGGGQRSIIINMNRAMIDGGIHVTAQRVESGIENVGSIVREEFMRLLQSINAI